MKEKDLIKGKYYLTSYPDQGDYIFLCKQDGSGLDSTWIRTNDSYNTFKSNGGNLTQNNGFKKYRLATPEECEHLEQCIQADKYVDYKKEELPKEWAIKVTEKNRAIISKARLLYGTYKNVLSGSIKDLWIINNKNSSIIGSSTSNGYTEITDDQFKRLVLKENNMEKKIIGYKLLKPYPGLEVGKVYDKHEHQGNTEWFEPQYEEEIQIFKKGDVVTCLNTPSREGKQGTYDNGGKGAGWEENLTFIVTGIDETSKGYSIIWGPDNGGVYDNYLRSATEEEKKDIFTVQIAEYPSKYTKKGVHFGCNFYSKEDVKSLLDIMGRENSSIRAVLVAGNNKVTRSQLTIILSGIENSQND